MKPLFSPLVLAVILLLPSCVRWNIGENILTAAETHVALDYTQPVDGKLYREERKGREPRYYALLPEVRYRVMPDIVRVDMYDFKGYAVCGREPTGRVAVAEVKMDWYSSRRPGKRAIAEVRREVPGLPASAIVQAYSPESAPTLSPDSSAQRDAETAPGFTRRAVASALSCTVDPALTFVSTTAFLLGEFALTLVAAPVLCIYCVYDEVAPEPACDECRQSSLPAES